MSWISDLFGGGTRTVQSSTSSPPPAWIQEEGEGVFRTAKDLATRPYEPSPVGRVAGISPEREQSFDLIRKGIGSWGPDMGAARGYASSAGMSTPDAMRAGGYMNPYTEDVINPTIDDIMKASGIERSRIATMAGMSGNRNSGRQGVLEAELAGNTMREIGRTTGGLRSAGYDKAMAAAGTDQARKLALSQLMQTLGLSASNMGLRDAAALAGVGGEYESKDQQLLDVQQQDFQKQKNYDFEMLNYIMSALSGVPYENKTTSTTPMATGSPLLQGAGGTALLLSLLAGR